MNIYSSLNLLVTFLIFSSLPLMAQDDKMLDSLLESASDENLSDSLRVMAYRSAIDHLPSENLEERLLLMDKAEKIALISGKRNLLAITYDGRGISENLSGNFRKALDNYFEGLKYVQRKKYYRVRSDLCWNLSGTYTDLHIADSIYYWGIQSMELFLTIKSHHGVGWRYSTIGERMFREEEFMRAIECWEKGGEYFKLLYFTNRHQAIHGLSNSNSNISMVYSNLGLWDIAASHIEASLLLEDQMNYYSKGWTQYILSGYYMRMGDHEKRIELLKSAEKNIQIAFENEPDPTTKKELIRVRYIILVSQVEALVDMDFSAMAKSTLSRAEELYKSNDFLSETFYHTAKVHYLLSINDSVMAYQICENQLSTSKPSISTMGFIIPLCTHWLHINKFQKIINLLEPIMENIQDANNFQQYGDACFFLSKAYAGLRQYQLAYNFQTEYEKVTDSLRITERSSDLIRKTLEFNHNRESVADSLKSVEQFNKQQREIEQKEEINTYQSRMIYLIGFGFVAVLVLTFWAFKNAKRVKNANTIIQKQKERVEEKNRDITDSINYAKRIQEAILPSNEALMQFLPNSFILYKPKDIVAGDFYWMQEIEGNLLIAVADCTGHGVPGAMVSVVCNNALNRSVREFGLTSPSDILNKTRELVIETFDKSVNNVRDGMDIALCSIDQDKQEITFSGANNGLYIVRKGELIECKPNKQPIGNYEHTKPFGEEKIVVEEGDYYYLSTDGFADQFGGENGKKYKYGPFKRFITSMATNDAKMQGKNLEAEFNRWKGNHEQLDDICVLGFKVG
jgi:serine phosphatase RsbU (regulator of sigma subunit)